MSWSFDAIGTRWVIDVPDDVEASLWSALQVKIRDRIADFDLTYSRFRDDSLIAQVARASGTYTFPPDADKLFRWYQDLYRVTKGAVTPLIGQTLVDAGYDPQYSLKPKDVLARPKPWYDVLNWRSPELVTKEPVLIDVGAAGKGYLVDLVSELIEAAGILSYCVDAGGDMRQRGARPLRVGLENPLNTQQVIGVLALQNRSLCGSAGNRRAWDKYHHTIDPKTLTSPTHILATWVLAESTMIADGLATALLFASPGDLLAIAPFEYAYLKNSGELVHSPLFPAKIFTSQPPKPGK